MVLQNNRILCTYLLGISGLLLIIGCNSGPKIVPVSGKITIDGNPLTTGIIMVYQKGYRPASAVVKSDGSFTFKTLNHDDGCLLGEHPISISSKRVINDTKTEYFIPARYSDIDKSNTKIKIDGSNSNLLIDLTWTGSGHSGPYISSD
jgi:hypothetical protein